MMIFDPYTISAAAEKPVHFQLAADGRGGPEASMSACQDRAIVQPILSIDAMAARKAICDGRISRRNMLFG
jgi:hypothetical protein